MTYGPLETNFFLRLLTPGDVLLFDHPNVFSWVIRHATNAPVTHTEVFLGKLNARPVTAASRNGIGVDIYPFNPDGLVCILRPKMPFNLHAAVDYQRSVMGQGYDWTGLWRAFVSNTWGRNNTKQWCSENSTNVMRAGGIEPFADDNPADMIAPGDFLHSPVFTHVWKAKGFPI